MVWAVAIWGLHVRVLGLLMIVFPAQLSGIAFAPFFRVERLLDTRAGRWLAGRFGPTDAAARIKDEAVGPQGG